MSITRRIFLRIAPSPSSAQPRSPASSRAQLLRGRERRRSATSVWSLSFSGARPMG